MERDWILEEWKFEENLEIDRIFGCGYPADELTKSWLLRNMDKVFGFPTLVRYSWKTCKVLLADNKVNYKIYNPEIEIDI